MDDATTMLFKILGANGNPILAGKHGQAWSLPTKNPDGTWNPGEVWDTGAEKAVHCTSTALHSTDFNHLVQWWSQSGASSRIFEVEYLDTPTLEQGKWAGTKARLIREIEVTDKLRDWLLSRGRVADRDWKRHEWVRRELDRGDADWQIDVVRTALLARLEASRKDLNPPLYEKLKAATEAFTPEAYEKWLSEDSRRRVDYRYVVHTRFWQDFQVVWKDSLKPDRAITSLLRAYYRAQKELGDSMPKLPADMEALRKQGERLARGLTRSISYAGYVDISYSGLYLDEGVKQMVEDFEKDKKAREQALIQQWDKDNPIDTTEFDPRVALGMTPAPKTKRGI